MKKERGREPSPPGVNTDVGREVEKTGTLRNRLAIHKNDLKGAEPNPKVAGRVTLKVAESDVTADPTDNYRVDET